ncbi:metal ABC transporter permease [Candidatus Saccharibacteria bacterium]|nr:metal ABC transporter permease [Candidatus Saccharibacteria bacterium]
MLDFLQYTFIQRAFEAGIIVGVIAPLIGTFLVTKRYSLLADSLSHVALAGVAIGLLFGISPLITAIIFSIAAGFIIERIRSKKLASGDTALAMFISGGLGLAVILVSLGHGFNVDLFSYLFGSITTVTQADISVIAIVGIIVIIGILILYKQLLYLSFDEEAATVSGLKVSILNYSLMIATAITVVLAMRIVGVLLIGALMVIPVVTATQFKKSFAKTMILGLVISQVAVLGGLLSAYYFNLAAGGAIVVLSLIFFALSRLYNHKS